MRVETFATWLRSRPLAVALASTLTISASLAGCAADKTDESSPEVETSFGALLAPVYQVNCGGGSVSPFTGDQFASGGSTWNDGVTVSTSGVANAAPAAVYQSERYGEQTYTFRSLTAGSSYTVRMHFAETKFTSAGQRRFNVLVNGAQALTNFDIFAEAGAKKALVRDVQAVADPSGQIAVRAANIVDNAKFCGLEILADSGPANQTPTVATAARAGSITSTSAALSVLGADDGGESSLIYTWSVTGTPPAAVAFSTNGNNAAKNTNASFGASGTYALRVTIRDASNASVTSDVSVVVPASATTVVHSINSGGGEVAPFSPDQFATGGSTWTTSNNIDVQGVANAAPATVYKTERYGEHSYTFGSLTPGGSYLVRLHMAETKFTSAGQRRFNVLVNNAMALSNLDIFAAAGANKALVRDVDAVAGSDGRVVVRATNIVDNAKVDGIELLAKGGNSNSNKAPTVATPASASPSAVSGASTTLSALGSDDGGEASLTYTWATTGTPPAAVTFSPNGTNAAKSATASFSKAGSYALSVTMRDGAGATVASNLNVVVNQTLTSVSVTPGTAQVATGRSQAFQGSARDQFGNALSPQPGLSWSVSGGGSINSSGVFTAGSSAGGPFTVRATSGSTSGTASVTVTASPSTVTYSTNFDVTETPISEGGVWRKLGLDWTRVAVANGLAYGTQTGSGGFDDSYAILSGFPANQTASGTIHLESGVPATWAEVEILLRWSDSDHYSIGYECNLAKDGSYAEIIRWPGPPGTNKSQYAYLASAPVSGGVHDGDVFSARVVGNTITSYLNGRVLVTATDNAITSGNPGIGFYAEGGPASPKFSFTSFSASGL